VVRRPPFHHVEYRAPERVVAPGLFSTRNRCIIAAPTASMPLMTSGSML
jgi:hypothetical protein